jgi:hypothetical protein
MTPGAGQKVWRLPHLKRRDDPEVIPVVPRDVQNRRLPGFSLGIRGWMDAIQAPIHPRLVRIFPRVVDMDADPEGEGEAVDGIILLRRIEEVPDVRLKVHDLPNLAELQTKGQGKAKGERGLDVRDDVASHSRVKDCGKAEGIGDRGHTSRRHLLSLRNQRSCDSNNYINF